jgi:hypothetical protein
MHAAETVAMAAATAIAPVEGIAGMPKLTSPALPSEPSSALILASKILLVILT